MLSLRRGRRPGWCVPLLWGSFRRASANAAGFRAVTSWTVSGAEQQLTRGNSPSADAESCRFGCYFAALGPAFRSAQGPAGPVCEALGGFGSAAANRVGGRRAAGSNLELGSA